MTDPVPEWARTLYSLNLSDDEKGQAAAILARLSNAAVLFLGNEASSVAAVRRLLQQDAAADLGSATGAGSLPAAAGASTVAVPDADRPRDQQGGLHLAWVGFPLMVLALVVDRGVSIVDEIKQCAKTFLEHNDVALATAYHGVRGVGLVASVGLGVVAAVRSCVKRLKVQPGRPRVSRLKRPKRQLDLAPASAGGMLPAAGTSTTGQVDASQDS